MSTINEIIDNDESWQISLKQAFAQNEVDRANVVSQAGVEAEGSVVLQTIIMSVNPSDAELRAVIGTPTKDSFGLAIRDANGAMYLIGYDLSADTFFHLNMTEAT